MSKHSDWIDRQFAELEKKDPRRGSGGVYYNPISKTGGYQATRASAPIRIGAGRGNRSTATRS